MAVDNILQRGVKVTLDRERTLTYPMSAMAYLAEQYGSIVDTFTAFSKVMPSGKGAATWRMDLETIKTIIHFTTAGLLADDPTITYAEVAQLIDMTNMGDVINAVAQALTAYMPKVPEVAPSPPVRPRKKE